MKDAKFMSAALKEKVLKAWKRFIKGGFQKKHFTKDLYKHIHTHCDFIAHYDIHGFYRNFFENPADTTRFLRQFNSFYGCLAAEGYGDAWYYNKDYHDLNKAMVTQVDSPFSHMTNDELYCNIKFAIGHEDCKWQVYLNICQLGGCSMNGVSYNTEREALEAAMLLTLQNKKVILDACPDCYREYLQDRI